MNKKTVVKTVGGFHTVCAVTRVEKNDVVFSVKDHVVLDSPTRYSIQIGIDSHIDVLPEAKEQPQSNFQYLNHSCDPNISVDTKNMAFVALKVIDAGEELRFDYNSTEFDMTEVFVCSCGAKNCNGEISGFKHVDEEKRLAIVDYTADYLLQLNQKTDYTSK